MLACEAWCEASNITYTSGEKYDPSAVPEKEETEDTEEETVEADETGRNRSKSLLNPWKSLEILEEMGQTLPKLHRL